MDHNAAEPGLNPNSKTTRACVAARKHIRNSLRPDRQSPSTDPRWRASRRESAGGQSGKPRGCDRLLCGKTRSRLQSKKGCVEECRLYDAKQRSGNTLAVWDKLPISKAKLAPEFYDLSED